MRRRTIAAVAAARALAGRRAARVSTITRTRRAAVGAPPASVPGSSATSTTVGSGETGPGPAPGVTDTEIKIGYLLPITGAAPIPVQFDSGVSAYWNYVNARGGIGGRKVKVIIEDTQSQAEVGKDKAKKLIEDDHVFAIVVLDRLENQQAIGEYLNSRKCARTSRSRLRPTSRRTRCGRSASRSTTRCRASWSPTTSCTMLHATKVAIVSENTPTLDPGREAFTKEIAALHADVVYAKTIEGQGNDFSNEALALSNSGATAVWLYMAPTTAATLANQADASGFHPTWFANSISWAFELTFLVGPKSLKGARAFSPWLPLSDPRTDTYKQAVRQTESGLHARRSRPRRLGRGPDRGEGTRERRDDARTELVPRRDAAPPVPTRRLGADRLQGRRARRRQRRRGAEGGRWPLGARARLHRTGSEWSPGSSRACRPAPHTPS